MFANTKIYFKSLISETPLFRAFFAVSLALIYATTVAYPAAHVTAIFTLMFIGPGKNPVTVKSVFIYPFVFYVLGFAGVFIGYYLIDYPFVVLPLIALCIFWSFRALKIPASLRLLFLLLVVLIPFASISANSLGKLIISALVFNLFMALMIAKFSYLIFPLTFLEKQIKTNTPESQTSIPPFNIDKVAFNGILVILPLVTYIYFTNATANLLVLVFTLVLAFDPMVSQSKKGYVLLIANLWGGVIGILAYALLVISPHYLFYIFLCIAICLYFVINIYSSKKIAPVFVTGFNTFFVVMGTIATSTDGATQKIWDRLMQIGIALVYTIVAYKIVNTLNNPIKPKN